MVIDNSRDYILTNYQAARNQGKATNSDHFTQYMDVDLELITEKPQRIEYFDFKNKHSQEMFKKLTSETAEFLNCFNNGKPLQKQVDEWQKVLKINCQKAFKKFRIRRKTSKPIKGNIRKLIDERNSLVNCSSNHDEIDKIDNEIADQEAEENRKIVMENFKQLADNPEQVNMQQMWKLHSKLWPKTGGVLPTAKKNHRGGIVSAPGEIKKLLAKEYKDRLRSPPYRPDLLEVKKRKKRIFELKLKLFKK